VECDWKLDGAPQERLKAGDAEVVPTSLGKHLVKAVTTDGQDEWQTVFSVSQEGQELVEIQLKAVRQRRADEERRTEEEKKPTSTYAATGLMWAKRDNRSDVTWQQARHYCASLNTNRYAGYTGWRLAEIDELGAVYDPGTHQVKIPLEASGWEWSGTLHDDASGQAWLFVGSGKRVEILSHDADDIWS
jgi:hypothetical protein